MVQSPLVMTIGAICFGVAVGFVTYRTLVRTQTAAITDLAAVIGAVGGGAVTGLFDPRGSDLFGWYSIGLLGGMAVFFLLYLKMNGKDKTASVMSGSTVVLTDTSGNRAPVGPRV